MASVRNIVAFKEINPTFVTFTYNADFTYSADANGGSTAVCLAVKMVGDKQVGLSTDAAHVIGRLVRVHDDVFCTVQVSGFCLLPVGSSVTVTAGLKIVGALGASSAKGYVRNVAVATLAEVAAASGRIVDTSSAANTLIAGTSVAGVAVNLSC